MNLFCIAIYSVSIPYYRKVRPLYTECTSKRALGWVSICPTTWTRTSSPLLSMLRSLMMSLSMSLMLKVWDAIVFYTFKIHIPNQPWFGSDGVLHSSYPHINNCSSFFDHISCDQVGNACKRTEPHAYSGAKQSHSSSTPPSHRPAL